MKEFYTAPEVEITCFAPVEELAYDDSWQTFGITRSSDANSPVIDNPVTNPEDGDPTPAE